jgi:DNA polymerase (family 10)
MTNKEIAKILFEMAELLEMDNVPFKPRAYKKASEVIESHAESLAEVHRKEGVEGLMKVSGIGKGIAEHIEALLDHGTFPEYEHLKKKMPVNISELTKVEGVGPKSIKVLWKELGIRDLDELEKAIKAHKLRGLSHFGEKSEDKILKSIEFLRRSSGRQVLGFIIPEILELEKTIRARPGVIGAWAAGSVRRRKETVGDIDILVVVDKPENAIERFELPEGGIKADLRFVGPESYGAALLHFTGSKTHNVALRGLAIRKGLKLNEYGLWRGEKLIAGKTEEEIYDALGLQYIEPEMREDMGEIDLALENKLPELIKYGSLKGDLQVQTNWTDGENSIEEMARAAVEVGLQYIAVTDHTKSLAMTGGSDEAQLLRQKEEIEKLNNLYAIGHTPFAILSGAEVNIMKDGTLDINDETLVQLDVVGAAVHSHFKLTREEQTRRVIRAMENPNVDIIFHPTGRIIGRREAIELDMDEIISAAKRTGTVLEIDAFPDRSDLKDEYIKKCVDAGVKMTIDTDAHNASHFQFLEHGISQARRGWATERDIINTLPVDKFLKKLK